MKTISKHFETLRKAERFLWRLYSQYNHVETVSVPFGRESGIYTFKVS